MVMRIDPIEMPLPVQSSSDPSPPSASFEMVWALLYTSPSELKM